MFEIGNSQSSGGQSSQSRSSSGKGKEKAKAEVIQLVDSDEEEEEIAEVDSRLWVDIYEPKTEVRGLVRSRSLLIVTHMNQGRTCCPCTQSTRRTAMVSRRI